MMALVQSWGLPSSRQQVVQVAIEASPRPLGPALYQDLALFVKQTDDVAVAISAFVLPQLEGSSPHELQRFLRAIKPYLSNDEFETVVTGAKELLDFASAERAFEAGVDDLEPGDTREPGSSG